MENVIAWLLRGKLYTWDNVYRKKKWNAKVRNHNLRGSEGRPQGASQAPPIFFFYRQAFVEAVGVMAAVIAQVSAVGSQGGPSNLQRFKSHHPPTFTGGGDPMVADHWLR